MSTLTVFLILTFPSPVHSPHWLPLGTVDPVPAHVGQVLAIWNPLSITNVRVPDPPHVPQVDRLAPFFIPLPEHVPQVWTGVILIFRTAPLQASMKLTLSDASMSLPRMLSLNPAPPPPPNALPNNCSNKSD